jgi:ribosomal protein S18 acetylase RimI-like enzyme
VSTGCDLRVRRLRTADELYAASGDDAFVRAEHDPTVAAPAWACDGAVAFLRGRGGRSLAAVGTPAAAAALTAAVLPELRAAGTPAAAVTLPRGALSQLPAGLSVVYGDDWDWLCTADAPDVPPLRGDGWTTGWLDEHGALDEDEVRAFLQVASPTHSAEPGSSWVRRWAGIRDPDGGLTATAAHCENVPGVPHLASIASHPDLRGRGLGAAITAWITRELLREAPVVTLGLYASNDVARRLYLRLGYAELHRFSSGRPVLADDLSDDSAVPSASAPPAGCCGVVDCPHG